MVDKKQKFFIFSDESGSWHDKNDIYVRAWVVITEEEYNNKLITKVDEINSFRDSKELKWSGFSSEEKYFKYFDNISYRIFITISCPADIDWENKYNVTKKFENSIKDFDFGGIDIDLKSILQDKIYREIKNGLFLHYYEKHHIENAKNGIERVIKADEYELIYRIDPPQLPKHGWKDILYKINGDSNINIEFPKSIKTQGIQFADLLAGAIRSYLIIDKKSLEAQKFLSVVNKNMINNDWDTPNPNPNLIFFNEISVDIKSRAKKIKRL